MDTLKSETVPYTEDPTSWHYIFTLPFFTSFLITLLLPTVVSPALGTHYIPEKYSNLGEKKSRFDSLLSSAIHAVVVSVLSCYLVVTGGMGTNMIFSKSPTGFAIMQISLGYFVADFIVCLIDKDLRTHKCNLVHHIVGIVHTFFGLYLQGKLMYFLVLRHITAMSTPFINLFWMLTVLNYGDSFLFALGKLGVFFAFRVAPLYWLWQLMLVAYRDPDIAIVPGSIQFLGFFSSIVIDTVHIYWFLRMVKKAVQEFNSKRKKSS